MLVCTLLKKPLLGPTILDNFHPVLTLSLFRLWTNWLCSSFSGPWIKQIIWFFFNLDSSLDMSQGWYWPRFYIICGRSATGIMHLSLFLTSWWPLIQLTIVSFCIGSMGWEWVGQYCAGSLSVGLVPVSVNRVWEVLPSTIILWNSVGFGNSHSCLTSTWSCWVSIYLRVMYHQYANDTVLSSVSSPLAN